MLQNLLIPTVGVEGIEPPTLSLSETRSQTTELNAGFCSKPMGSKGVEPLPIRLKGGHAAVTPQPQMLELNAFQAGAHAVSPCSHNRSHSYLAYASG
jgi:hypothetical protein